MAQDLNQINSPEINIKDLWLNVLKKLNDELGNEIFNSWIKNINVQSLDDDVLFFSVPTRFIRDWITSHYLDKIIYFLNIENSNIKRVKISIDNMLAPASNEADPSSSFINTKQNTSLSFNETDDWPLDERFIFEKFVVHRQMNLPMLLQKNCAVRKFEFNPLFCMVVLA